MPPTDVCFYAENDGSCPLLEWLDGIPRKAQDKCIVRVEQLAESGHELRRPFADYLGDDIYELRARHQKVNYRMLYFFHACGAVVTHGLTKEDVVPRREIDLALARKGRFDRDPGKHMHKE